MDDIFILLYSLLATIKLARPDLLKDKQSTEQPIAEEMPAEFMSNYKRDKHIEDIGEPMTACFLSSTDIDPTNWYFEFILFIFKSYFKTKVAV